MHIYNVWFLILLLLLFSLFDNYVGFRPFDAIGVLFLIGYTIFNLKNLKIDSSVLIITSIFTIIFIIPSILVGIIRYESPAGILVFIGVMVFLVISSISIDESKIKYLREKNEQFLKKLEDNTENFIVIKNKENTNLKEYV